MRPEPDIHDVVGAAAEYIWYSVRFNNACLPLDVAIPEPLRQETEALLRRYVEGARLTPHRSADAYEDLREPFAELWTSKIKNSTDTRKG
ncbi:hypothetical protein MUO32_26210 [Shinella sp. CPCC 101442]|uniref:hypothetical protein n=1 Tax=Shinella sp. CPCC 101442 TaxID=2932265 RepID=UPI00215374EE|nr:hypothetical protein [Shinella sp. CPCC 101442]MCR6502526.1 hypothetical protein [Shinella sp. CPCC 101442]